MVVMGVPLQVLSSRRNVMNQATNLYANAEYRSAAVDLVKAIEATSCRGAPAGANAAQGAAAAAGPSADHEKGTDRLHSTWPCPSVTRALSSLKGLART